MKRKEFSTHLFFTIFLWTTLIFVAGLFLGAKISEEKIADVAESNERIRLQTMGIDIQNLILQDKACDAFDSQFLFQELLDLSEKIALMENSLGWDDPSVMSAKEYFALLELRHWYLLKKSVEECDKDNAFILYFYSNKGDCPMCGQQGTVLTNVRRNNASVSVYHFDINIDNPALNSIKELYNITQTPALIINEETYVGYQSLNEVREALNSGS